MDIFAKFKNNKGPLGQYSDFTHGYFTFPNLEGALGPRMKFRGKEVVVWSINDYLGLANHPEVRKIDAEACKDWGLAYPMGSRMMSGETAYHEHLERELANFAQKESALLLNYGYQGILSIVDTVLDRRDIVVYDKDCHACIYDGIRMHLGKRLPFKHNDIESFAKQIKKAAELAENTRGGILVISEGVFGMRGQQGILKEICAFKDKYDFRFLVDDAHGFGTLGVTGAGAGEEQGVQDKIDLYFSTFAKSMASIGAFVAGNENIINILRYNLRSQIFAKSLPMPFVIGNLKRLEILRTHPELRERLWSRARMLQSGLRNHGFDLGKTASCVTPVFLNGSTFEAANLIMDLRENYSIFCSAVIYPVVPKDVVLLRLIPTAVHTEADIQQTIEAFAAVPSKLKGKKYQHAVDLKALGKFAE